MDVFERTYGTLSIPFTNTERSMLRLEEGAVFRVARVMGLPYAYDGCTVTLERVDGGSVDGRGSVEPAAQAL